MLAASTTRFLISVFGKLPQLQTEGEVVVNAHVRIERVILENHRDVAIFRRDVVNSFVADEDVALRDLLEAGDHAQSGRFSATRGPDEHDKLTVRDLEADIVDRGHVSAFSPG